MTNMEVAAGADTTPTGVVAGPALNQHTVHATRSSVQLSARAEAAWSDVAPGRRALQRPVGVEGLQQCLPPVRSAQPFSIRHWGVCPILNQGQSVAYLTGDCCGCDTS